MRNQPQQLLPLIYAIESAEDVVKHLKVVFESLMEDIDNGDTPTLTEDDHAELKSAANWQQTAAKYLKEFQEQNTE